MNELDRKIKEALQQETAGLPDDMTEDPSMFELLLETFRGQHRWLARLGAFWTLVFLGLGVLSAYQFLRADGTRDQLMWAAACILCVSTVAMLKIWYFLELNKNAVLREIKRLELQVARLASQREK